MSEGMRADGFVDAILLGEFFHDEEDHLACEACATAVEENGVFKKELEAFAKEKAAAFARRLVETAEEVNGIKVVRFDRSEDPAMVREAATRLQKEVSGFVFAGAFPYEGKPNLVLMYSQDLVDAGKNAGKDIREAAKFILGGGGGQPGLATAGGKNVEGLPQALAKMVETATA